MQIELIHCFNRIRQLSDQLQQAIMLEDRALPAWLAPCGDASALEGETARRQIAAHCVQYWHRQSGDGRKAERQAGALAASDDTLRLLFELNRCKQQFQRELAALRQPDSGKAGLLTLLQAQHGRDEGIQEALARAGMQRLNLTQVYRQLPLLDATPRLIGFSWARGKRSKKRLSREQAMALVRSRFGEGEGSFQRQLAQLPEAAQLAQIRPVQPSLIANCAIGEGLDTWRCQRQGHSPLFPRWPSADQAAVSPPRIRWPGPLSDQMKTQPRSEKGEEILLIPALHLYQLV